MSERNEDAKIIRDAMARVREVIQEEKEQERIEAIAEATEKAVESGALEQAVDDFRFLSAEEFEAARKDLQDIIDAVRRSE